MGLALPLALLGLLAGLLPLIAHRVRRRDLPRRPLPTVHLLQRALAAQRAKRSLADVLLLALRIALIVVACMATAAPYVTARVAFGDGEVGSAAIVIDDSLSMMRQADGERLLARAAQGARDAIDALPPGSEVSVALGGAPARVLVLRTKDLASARAAVAELPELSHRGADLQGAARLALQQLTAGRHARRHLLILSDFASHTGLSPEDLQLAGADLRLERVGDPPARGNLTFGAVTCAPDPTTPGQTSVAFEVRAHGPAPERVTVRAGDGEPIEVTITDGAGRGTLHVATPDEDADPIVELELLNDDLLPEDSRRSVLLRGRGGLEVLMVNGDPQPATAQDELWYAARALRLAPQVGLPLRLTSIDAEGLRGHELSGTDVVVLANLPAPSGPTAQRLEAFVRAGGGLLVTAGKHVEPQRYNARLGNLLPAHIGAVEHGAAISLGAATTQPATTQPATPAAPGSLGDAAGLDRAVVHSRLVLEARSQPALAFSDGLPAVAMRRVGQGRVALLATSIDADWADLPYRPGFVPLLVNLTRSVASRSAEATVAKHPGEAMQIQVPPGATRMEVVTPGGFRHAYEELTGGSHVTLEDTLTAGAYRVLVAGPGGSMRAAPGLTRRVELPGEESDLQPAALPSADSVTTGDEATTAAVGAGTIRRDLSPLGFLFAGLLVVAEGLVRRRRR